MAALTPEQYIGGAMETIEGWFYPHDALCFLAIDRIQGLAGVDGNLVEVGVWKGKCLGLLALLRRGHERLYGFDLFTDGASADAAREALALATGDANAAELVTANTLELPPGSILERVPRPVRLLHVDGGHRYEEALNDLRKFAPLVGEHGVIAVDDYYDRDFPGVSAAVADFTRETDFVPFLTGNIKLYLCRSTMADAYVAALLGMDHFRATSHVARFRARPMLISGSAKAQMYRASVEEFLRGWQG